MSITITVRQNDNLTNIVKREYGITNNVDIFNAIQKIKDTNHLKDINKIFVGQEIELPDNIECQSAYNVVPPSDDNYKWSWNINGKIENTKQGWNVGDCWLLSTLNSMKDTEWGAQVIKDAIRPDGNGGAIVTFMLEGGKDTKEYHVTLKEINAERKKGLCSKGDDDVAAIELAFKKHFGNIVGGGREKQIVELLCGEASEHKINVLTPNDEDMENFLDEIEQNPNKYCTTVGVLFDSKHLYGEHEYQLKQVETDKNGQRWLYLVNPWDSAKTIKVTYEEFKSCMLDLIIIEPTKEPSEHLKTHREKAEEKRKENYTIRSLHSNLNLAILQKDDEKVKQIVNNIKTDNILYLFDNDESIELVIKTLDLYKYGWGNGKEKKDLIMRLVEVLCYKAQETGVNPDVISETRNICAKECNALLFTNEKNIISALQTLHKCITNENESKN